MLNWGVEMISRLYLLNPPFFEGYNRDACWQAVGRGGNLRYPIWLAYGAAQISNNTIKLVDAVANGWSMKKVMLDVDKFDPNVIIVNSSWSSLENDINIADNLTEEYPLKKIVMYGTPFSIGDFELRELLGEKRLEANEIPFVSPIYEKFLEVKDYFLSDSLYPMVQIWGHGVTCPHECIFCHRIHRPVTFRDPKLAVKEMLWVKSHMDVKEIHFEDDTFSLDKGWTNKFCSELQMGDENIVWSCQERADVSFQLLKRMKKAGCRYIIYGCESGNNDILRRIKKGTSVEQLVKFAKNVRKAGMLLQGDFIVGLPGETLETIDTTKKLIHRIKPDVLQVTVAIPYKGTEFYDWVKSSGYLLSENYLDERGYQKCVIQYPELSSNEIVDAVDEILKQYYLNPKYLGRIAHQVLRRNGIEEFKRIYRSGRAFWSKYR